MRETTSTRLEFGDPEIIDASLSGRVRGLRGSEILKIATEIRGMAAAGREVVNLTVGDFDPRMFPIPAGLRQGVARALEDGETNYPPSDGMTVLRRAVASYTARQWGVSYPVESVLIASGARPILYAAFRCVLERGDRVVYPVPSWNNNHYAWLVGATPVEVRTRPEAGFQPALGDLAPHLGAARLVCVNTPLNPAGTVMEPAEVEAIARAVVEENRRRAAAGRPRLFLLYDQVYAALVFGGARHVHPVALVPDAAPWVISLDGISKSLAATGLRVGWVLAPPPVVARMRDLLGHVGAWAPRAEQVAVARFLDDVGAVREFQSEMDGKVLERLDALHAGLVRMKAEGYPVETVEPRGAIYLTLRLDVIGRVLDGAPLTTNEDVRRALLERVGLAVVPFQAFGLDEETGWFRLSVGAVGLEAIRQVFPRLRSFLDAL